MAYPQSCSGLGGCVVDHTEVGGTRLDRLENDVSSIRGEVGGLKAEFASVKADVQSLAGILTRIEQGVSNAQQRADTRELAGRPNLIAVVSVLISIISILIGGAWLVSGNLARLEERSMRRDVEAVRMWSEIDRSEQRVYKQGTQQGVRGDATD